MTVITTEKLGDTVGAEVVGVDRERLLDDEALPAWTLEALEANGALVFRDLHLDDADQVAFSKRLGTGRDVRHRRAPRDLPGHARPDEEPGGRLPARHVRLAHRRLHRRHPDHGHDAERARGRRVGRRDRVRQHLRGLRRPDRRREGPLRARVRVVHTIEASQRLVNDDPSPEELAMWRSRPPKEHPLVWTHQSGRRSLVLGATAVPRRRHGRATRAGRCWTTCSARSTTPERVYRHEWSVGDMVIWDNRGVLHRACRYDPTSPRDMHRTTLRGDEAIQ